MLFPSLVDKDEFTLGSRFMSDWVGCSTCVGVMGIVERKKVEYINNKNTGFYISSYCDKTHDRNQIHNIMVRFLVAARLALPMEAPCFVWLYHLHNDE